MWRFSGSQYGFRSSRSTAADLTEVSDIISRAVLISPGLLKLYHLINPRLSTGFGKLVFFTNLAFTEFRVRYLVLFLNKRRL